MTNPDLTSQPVLSVRNLTTAFRTDGSWRPVVRNVSFDVSAGETLAIVGESGSGKSVTSLSVMRLLAPKSSRIEGEVVLNGRNLLDLSEKAMRGVRGNEVSMIFQEPMTSLNPIFTIGRQISEVLTRHKGMTKSAARAETIRMLERVRIPNADSRFDEYPHQFSGGMRQRVAIAIALLHRPQLVIADEPTTALDVSVQAEILDMVKALVAEMGTSLIWVSHDLATVSSIADTIAVMRRGKIVEAGPARQVLQSPQHPYTQGLLDALPSRSKPGEPLASAATEAAGPMDLSGLGGAAIGAAPDAAFVKAEAIDKVFAPRIGFLRALAIRWGLMREPGPVHAVKSASVTIARGEILGLVGESGSGKSTLGRILCGIYPPTSGTVSVGGKPVRSATGKLGTHVQMIFQDPFASLDPRRTIFQSVAEGPIAHGFCTRADARDYVNRWLRAVAFDPALADRYPHQFSGGQRQRIAIARALAMQPEVIICDEPVASLDVSIQAQVINLLMELRRNLNITLLFISHDLSVVHHLCDRVVVMRHGEIVEQGAATQVFSAPRHAYTQMLLDAVPKLEA